MRYLITYADTHPPFLSDRFEFENHWTERFGMVVYDLQKGVYTTDGKTWIELAKDNF